MKGFSLVELLVAIGIFGVLSTVVIINLRESTPSRDVQMQADNVTSLLRQAQVQAFSGEQFNGKVPLGGYGVLFSKCPTAPCEVILFADVDGNFRYDGVSEQIQAVNLGSNVTIESISTGDTVNVMFKPPRPFICFDNNCSGVGDLTITLGSTKVTKTINVTINQVTGQISS